MTVVKNNPYRTLGLFGNSTEKELQKQIATIKRFAEVGKSKTFDFDFPFFGDVTRTTENVQEAASKIEHTKNKVLYALFWFINNGHIDEAALSNLKDGNIEKAMEIWKKTLKDGSITDKNYSSVSNLSTLQLGLITNNGSFDTDKFIKAIELKGKLLSSDAFTTFISFVSGDGITLNHNSIFKEFADEVINLVEPYLLKPVEKSGCVQGTVDDGIGLYRWKNGDLYLGEWKDGKRTGIGIGFGVSGFCYTGFYYLGKREGEGIYVFPNGSKKIGLWVEGRFRPNPECDEELIINNVNDKIQDLKKESGIELNVISIVQLINSFNDFPQDIKQYLTNRFTDTPINLLENKCQICKELRKESPGDAAKFGEELYSKTISDLLFLKNILGVDNVQFQVLANKIAQEILQCSIDYFNEHHESDSFDPGERALILLKLAKKLYPPDQVNSRVKENEDVIQDWVDNKSEREKNKTVRVDIEFTANKIDRFQSLTDSISSAKDLIVSCKPKLTKIKAALGSSDDLYMKISSAVVNNALNMLVSVVNRAQEGLEYDHSKRASLPSIISGALEVINLMSNMDMVYELRSRFNTNKSTISNINSQVQQYSSGRSSSSSSSEWCYIATMAYGSYEHPQVFELRKFRDNKLSNSILGRGFIKIYYYYSPKAVQLLKGKPLVNQMIKLFLDFFIRIIK